MQYFERIRNLREDAEPKLNQTDIAKVLGTTQQYYSEYENGKRELPTRHLITLCKLYNISADYILGFTDEQKELPKK